MSDFLKSLLAYVPTKITNDPAVDGFIFKAIAVVATALTTWIATKFNIVDPKQVATLGVAVAAALTVLAAFVWGWIASRAHLKTSVTAGMIASASTAVSPKSTSDVKAILSAFGSTADKLNQAELDKIKARGG